MCSSRRICGSGERPADRSSRPESAGSGAHYALCALGVGLIALGVVMIVWTVIPVDGEASGGSGNSSGNVTASGGDDDDGEEEGELSRSSSIAMVLVGVGLALLLLSICLGVRSKRRANNSSEQNTAPGVSTFMDHVAGEQEEVPDPAAFNVPTYEEVVGSSDYPVRHSNLRQSNTHLPSYEDILAAVENEGREQPAEDSPLNDAAPPAAAEHQADTARQPSLPARSGSRASRLLRPLRVRRIKSDKLHLKDFRIQIRSPTHNPVTIEPITPPPQYENGPPELG
ncbi:transmembrane protein 51b [Syngnathoides biaculeatus]|uniref:transmembrane protein 51b n=1 Tax=Syngnathoides biaculeatus TaxID=300417 RepID=UPI002ADE466D|nr:transmembrane protein 51b [Syngnathoides biaculeatus]XP_061688244.1 transmembrane protein 51b [Syngnathoides biaculeatus]XP_061688245.1 transmembrane protein 51b [Syngnathoides biaculeatus]XP_061688246.1 transmembrane protein 51b [Syngnathoides biaculeatus]